MRGSELDDAAQAFLQGLSSLESAPPPALTAPPAESEAERPLNAPEGERAAAAAAERGASEAVTAAPEVRVLSELKLERQRRQDQAELARLLAQWAEQEAGGGARVAAPCFALERQLAAMGERLLSPVAGCGKPPVGAVGMESD